jgi:hypothetical protein
MASSLTLTHFKCVAPYKNRRKNDHDCNIINAIMPANAKINPTEIKILWCRFSCINTPKVKVLFVFLHLESADDRHHNRRKIGNGLNDDHEDPDLHVEGRELFGLR